jgi:hypothetical protein
VQVPETYVQPWLEHVDGPSWLHGVIVPVHVVVPGTQAHPDVHVPCDVYVLHAAGTPEHVPPRPASPGVQVQLSAVHSVWLLLIVLVQVLHGSGAGLLTHVPVPVDGVQPWHSEPPHSDVGQEAHEE